MVKNPSANVGDIRDVGLILGVGRSPGEGHILLKGPECFPGGSVGKQSACNVDDLGLIPGLGRSPGEGYPEYSLEGLMLKLQYFCHLMQRADSLEKTFMLGKMEGKRRRGW